MFAVLYSFEIIPDKKELFIEAWRELTLLIKKYEGGLGSRLHQQSETIFIAYAQWPDKSTWENTSGKMPESAVQWRKQMKEMCLEIKTIQTMDLVSDLLEEING